MIMLTNSMQKLGGTIETKTRFCHYKKKLIKKNY